MKLELVTTETQVSNIKELFREYQMSLDIDLDFQNFEQELLSLPGKYQPPKGRLYLALIGGTPAGCVALRPFRGAQCEMKRLYVRPQFRGRGLSKQLVNSVINDARATGYNQMLLDTLPSMETAIGLYLSFGFYEITPYYLNPIAGTRYLCLDL